MLRCWAPCSTRVNLNKHEYTYNYYHYTYYKRQGYGRPEEGVAPPPVPN